MRRLVFVATIFLGGNAACVPDAQTPTLVPTAKIEEEVEQETLSDDLPSKSELPPTNTPETSDTIYQEVKPPEVLQTTIPKPTDTIVLPTITPVATATLPPPTFTKLPTQPEVGTGPVGTIRVNHWIFEITDVRSDPGLNPDRQSVTLLGNLTNEGTQNDTFVAYATIMLLGESGNEYEDDHDATHAARNKYGTEIPASINPGATKYIAIGFDTVATDLRYTIIPGLLVSGWSGNLYFDLSTIETLDTRAEVPPPSVPGSIASLRVNHWLFEITNVLSDQGFDSSWQSVVIQAYLTNEGTQTDSFSPSRLMLRDMSGREYEEDNRATRSARDKYGTEHSGSVNPGETRFISIAFETPNTEKAYTIIPGNLVAGWSGDITFMVP